MPTDCKLTGVVKRTRRHYYAEIRSHQGEAICFDFFHSEDEAVDWLESAGVDEIRREYTP